MKVAGVILLLTLLFAVPAFAGGTGEIELNDGSRIFGEIVSVENGFFVVKSETLGVVRIEQVRIRSIRYQDSPSKAAPDTARAGKSPGRAPVTAPDEAKTLKDAMMGDPAVMDIVEGLRDDPDFQAVIGDPELMSAIQSGDISALLANPKFQRLLEKEEVQKIGKRIGP